MALICVVSAYISLRASSTNLPDFDVSQLAAKPTEIWTLAFSKEILPILREDAFNTAQ
jgi:hypothetical protein